MKSIKIPVLALTTLTIVACSSNKDNKLPKLDYQSENNKVISLEVPPDLHNPREGDLYTLPSGTVATPNALDKDKVASNNRVLAKVDNAHIERSGSQRWLVVDNKTATEMWPILRAFWQENGFTIYSEEPRAGLMETEWAENRAKLPNQGLRKLFDKVGFGGVYTTSERDKFLVRMEHNREGGLDIFFTHKGLEEVYADNKKDTTVWQPRANDPNLEAAFLARFMQYLGLDEAAITKQIEKQADSKQGTQFAKLEGDTLLVYGSAERNVNRIGAALDRLGLSVQQYVSERGMFVVKPAQKESDFLQYKEEHKGLLSRVFSFGKDKQKKQERQKEQQAPQMFVFLEAVGNEGQRIHLLDQFGKPYTGKDAHTWINGLYNELR